MKRYRAIWLATMGVASVALAAAAVAWACTPQANIFLDQSSARAGQVVGGHGVGFGPGNTPGVTEVQLRFNSMSGPALWSGSSDAQGYLAFSFTVPAVAPGYYVIVAQRASAPDEPYRAVLEVVAPAAAKPKQTAPAAAKPKHTAPAASHPVTPSVQHQATAPAASHPSPPIPATTISASTRAPAAAPQAAPARPAQVTQPTAAPAQTRPVARARHRMVVQASPQRVRLAPPAAAHPQPISRARAARVHRSRGLEVPWYLLTLAALALLTAAGGAGGAYVGRRRRPRAPLAAIEAESPAPIDPVEAELQQILAEERGPSSGEPTVPSGTEAP